MAHTQSHSQVGSTVDAVVTGANALMARVKLHLKRRAVYNQTMRELTQMTDSDLRDLGMSRANFKFIAHEAANDI